MSSLRSHEGYLMIDQRNSPGMTEEQAVAAGLPPQAAKGLFESASYTCSHCNSIVVIEPKRTRERAYCRGCDQRICDGCGFIRAQDMKCRSFKALIDEMQEADLKQAGSSSTLLLP